MFNNPIESNGQLDTAAISTHELYESYIRAGFSEDQSFELTKIAVRCAFGVSGG